LDWAQIGREKRQQIGRSRLGAGDVIDVPVAIMDLPDTLPQRISPTSQRIDLSDSSN
jgi:hypothetical protein